MSKDKSRTAKYFDNYKRLGENIKNLRKSKNISQENLAFEVSSTRNYIGCIERAEKFPSLAFIFDLANALEVEVKDLFDFKF